MRRERLRYAGGRFIETGLPACLHDDGPAFGGPHFDGAL